MDEDPVAVQQRLGRLLKDLGVQPLQCLFQIELLAQHPAFHRKALLDFQQLGGRAHWLLLLGHQPLQALVVPAAHPAGEPGQRGARNPQLLARRANGVLKELPGVVGDIVDDLRLRAGDLLWHVGELNGHTALL